jgi:hypothetical protein
MALLPSGYLTEITCTDLPDGVAKMIARYDGDAYAGGPPPVEVEYWYSDGRRQLLVPDADGVPRVTVEGIAREVNDGR